MTKHIRPIDGKFQIVDNQITKTTNGDIIPVDEPLFLLRARDYLSVALLEHYQRLCLMDDCTNFQVSGIQRQIDRFKAWQAEHEDQMKQPGITRGL